MPARIGDPASDVVITGRGAVSPFGTGVPALLAGLHSDTVQVAEAPWHRPDGTSLGWFCPVVDFDPLAWMDQRVADGTDLFAQFALSAAVQAVDEAGVAEHWDPLRTAVVHGTSMGGMRALMQAQHTLDTSGPEAIDRKTMIKIWPNMAASQMTMRFGLHGPSLTVCTACASSIDAIGTAVRLIQSGRVDVAIAGGTEGGMPTTDGPDGFVPATFYGQSAYGMSALERPGRLEATRPFDRHRSGIVSGEGSAILVLERAEHAQARGATVLGRVTGYASLSDSYHPSSPEPSGRWESEVMTQALGDAGIGPGDVDAVVAHATSTPKGDTAEILAINQVFGGRRELLVTSLKGHIGHTGASAGAMGALVALAAMADGGFPHTAGVTDVDPLVEFHVVVDKALQIDPDVVLVNAFGFGGQDSSLVVQRPA